MKIKQNHLIAFSPCGGTLAVLRAIGAGLEGQARELDLTLPAARKSSHSFGPDDLVVIGFPVYGGRLPRTAGDVFATLQGRETPVVLAAVYGNRHYEDAILEMQREAEARGFVPIAAAAALAEHVYVEEVARGRPDAADVDILSGFGRAVAAYARSMGSPGEEAFVAPGEFPYRKETMRVGATPKTGESCTRCGHCAAICPSGAIPASAPDTADTEVCIMCMACVKKCPVQARVPVHPAYEQARSWLRANCKERKEPEFFPESLR